jgi:hypothetical protein
MSLATLSVELLYSLLDPLPFRDNMTSITHLVLNSVGSDAFTRHAYQNSNNHL